MSGFTPGPWEVLPMESGVEYLRVRGTVLGGRYKVCNVHAGLQHITHELLQSTANARLIAASPELLEAATDALAVMESIWQTRGRDDGFIRDEMGSELSRSYFLLRAASRKATGAAE